MCQITLLPVMLILIQSCRAASVVPVGASTKLDECDQRIKFYSILNNNYEMVLNMAAC